MTTQTITPETIKSDNEFLCGLELPEIQVYLLYIGTDRVQYYTFRNGELLFSGNDFKPSPLHCIDAMESCVELFSFQCLQIGDTDSEYFANYTPDQLAWSESIECEQVNWLISDFEDKDSEYFTEASDKITAAFIQG